MFSLLPVDISDSSHSLLYASSRDCKTSSASAEGPLGSTFFFPSPEGALVGFDLGRPDVVLERGVSFAPDLGFAAVDFAFTVVGVDFFIVM